MNNWHTDREQLENCSDVELHEIAEEYGLYSGLPADADLPNRDDMIGEIIEAAARNNSEIAEENERDEMQDFMYRNPGYEGSIADALHSEDEDEDEDFDPDEDDNEGFDEDEDFDDNEGFDDER